MHVLRSALLVVALAGSAGASSAQTTYADRIAFLAAAGPVVTDDYQTGYTPLVFVSDAAISAVKNLTTYTTTGLPGQSVVVAMGGEQGYCGGCNGSFRLSFTSAAFGGAGTGAVGFDYANVPDLFGPTTPYFAFVSFANGTSTSYALATRPSIDFPLPDFFGITSAVPVTSIHLGLANGSLTQNGGFVLDNLSVGVSAVPEPASTALLLLGLAAVAAGRTRRRD